MPLLILSGLVQLLFVAHVLKTGRAQRWVLIITMLPVLGCLAYILVELAPEFIASPRGQRVGRKIDNALHPDRDIEHAIREHESADTVSNSINLAEICLEKGRFDEAEVLYQRCLNGLNEFNPNILFGLAKSQFGLEKYDQVRETLDTLIAKNPDFKNQDAHLLYARALQQLKLHAEATVEYDVLVSYFSGPEAALSYGEMLQSIDQHEAARVQFQSIVDTAQRSPQHYRNLHKQWINAAKKYMQ